MNIASRLDALEAAAASLPVLESAEDSAERLDALLERLDAWRATCAAALAERGDPRGWEEWSGYRRFTQSVVSHLAAAPDLDGFTWWWTVLHRLHLALTVDAEARPWCVDGVPLERELMEALGADEPARLGDFAIRRSPWCATDGPMPSTFGGFFGLDAEPAEANP